MDRRLIRRLNELWRPIYPHLARWLIQGSTPRPGWILELGPFSGGISTALARQCEGVRPICLMAEEEIARTVKRQFGPELRVLVGGLQKLPFGASLRTVIFRGAFFFLTPQIIRETYRILKPGSWAILGGGYGAHTPAEEIAKIAQESKRLNDLLGKRWISRGELEEMLGDAGLQGYGEILEEGGLWVFLKKGSPQ